MVDGGREARSKRPPPRYRAILHLLGDVFIADQEGSRQNGEERLSGGTTTTSDLIPLLPKGSGLGPIAARGAGCLKSAAWMRKTWNSLVDPLHHPSGRMEGVLRSAKAKLRGPAGGDSRKNSRPYKPLSLRLVQNLGPVKCARQVNRSAKLGLGKVRSLWNLRASSRRPWLASSRARLVLIVKWDIHHYQRPKHMKAKAGADAAARRVEGPARWHRACARTGPTGHRRQVARFQLSYDAEDRDIFELFSRCGPIAECHLFRDSDSGRSRGIACVRMRGKAAGDAALAMNGWTWVGRDLKIKLWDRA